MLVRKSCIREPYLKVLARAKEVTGSVDYTDFAACVRDLEARNAVRESEETRHILKPH